MSVSWAGASAETKLCTSEVKSSLSPTPKKPLIGLILFGGVRLDKSTSNFLGLPASALIISSCV